MSGDNQLIQMVNDIGNFFRAEPRREDAIAGIVRHITSFWTPRMIEKLLEQASNGGIGLDDLPREAVGRLSAQFVRPPRQRPTPA